MNARFAPPQHLTYAPDPPLSAVADAEPEPDLDRESWWPSGLLEWFALGQTALPALLFLPGNQSVRFAIRASAFLASLAALGYWWMKGRPRMRVRHPGSRWLIIVTLILVVMLLHPDTPSVAAGVGQLTVYLAVMAPLFWVPAFVTDRRTLIRVLAVLLVCNGINSVVGVLQVYDADRWMPRDFSSAYVMNRNLMGTALYVGPNGRLIVRPPGLYDTPGAVCGAGTVASLLGIIFCLQRMKWWKRAVALGFAGAGLAAIYLSHVRSSFVVVLAMLLAYISLLVLQKQLKRAFATMTVAVALVSVSLMGSIVLGGATIAQRFATFLEESPTELYYNSRGNQVSNAVNVLLAEYPAGAGLGRWGVGAVSFDVPVSKRLPAEVQPAAWLLDGGIFLFLAYTAALIATIRFEFRIVSRLRDPNDRLWGAAVVAANVGVLVLVLTFVPFATQVGLQFWFLEGLLHGAMTMKPHR